VFPAAVPSDSGEGLEAREGQQLLVDPGCTQAVIMLRAVGSPDPPLADEFKDDLIPVLWMKFHRV
jgi:hypothetical protein